MNSHVQQPLTFDSISEGCHVQWACASLVMHDRQILSCAVRHLHAAMGAPIQASLCHDAHREDQSWVSGHCAYALLRLVFTVGRLLPGSVPCCPTLESWSDLAGIGLLTGSKGGAIKGGREAEGLARVQGVGARRHACIGWTRQRRHRSRWAIRVLTPQPPTQSLSPSWFPLTSIKFHPKSSLPILPLTIAFTPLFSFTRVTHRPPARPNPRSLSPSHKLAITKTICNINDAHTRARRHAL